MDLPGGKIRDKGTPIDNLSNFDSSTEEIIYICPLNQAREEKLLFVSSDGLIKLVAGSEFDVAKKTTAATKLNENEKLICAGVVGQGDTLVLQSKKNFFLRISSMGIPEKKKGAAGVRGMRLGDGDALEAAYILTTEDAPVLTVKGKKVHLNKLHISNRDAKGVKR